MAAGLPDRERLTEILAERVEKRHQGEAAVREIRDLANKHQLVDAISAAKDALGAPEFGAVVEHSLDDGGREVPAIAVAIAALAPKLRAVLTTNLDRILERAFRGEWDELPRATGDIATRSRYILKLHGALRDRSTWVLTRDDYDRAVYGDLTHRQAFTALFHTRPLLFIGYGPAGDDFENLLRWVHATAGEQRPRHFALVRRSAVDPSPWRKRRLEEAGVRLLTYGDAEGEQAKLVEILRELGDDAATEPEPRAASATPRTIADVLNLLRASGLLLERPLHVPKTSEHRTIELDIGQARPGQLMLRILRLERMDVVPLGLRGDHSNAGPRPAGQAMTLGLYELTDEGTLPGEPHRHEPPPVEAAVALRPDGSFLVALSQPPLEALPVKWFAPGVAALARRLRALGADVRVYRTWDDPLYLIDGAEPLILEEAIATFIREPLREHAEMCFSAWTDERERRFVPGRAKSGDGAELPVPEAIHQAIQLHRTTLLLGDFGSGKSTQLQRLAKKMADAYVTDKHAVAPVLLPLTGLRPDLSAIIERHIPGVSLEALRLAVDLGMAMPLFDGLDELDLEAGSIETAIDPLVRPFPEPFSRIVLTSRKTLFPTAERMSEILRPAGDLGVVEIQALNQAEVQEFVGKAAQSSEEALQTLDCIARTHDLENLAQRPKLLELIVQQSDKLTTGENTAATLYRAATEDWLDSRTERERHVERPLRLAFACGLARELFATGQESATFNEITKLIVEILGRRLARVPLDPAMLEVRTAVFLTFDETGGRYRFAHRSFLEYFVAVDIDERLGEDRAEALDLPRVSREVVGFLAGMAGWEKRQWTLRGILTAPYRRRVSENALLTLYYAACTTSSQASGVDVAMRARLAGADLAGLNLTGIGLEGADLTGANLSQTVLSLADLRGARATRAIADHAVFDGALLDSARFDGARLFGASFVDASMDGARWEGADLEGAVFLHATPDPAAASPVRAGARQPPAPLLRTGVYVRILCMSTNQRLLACAAGRVIKIVDAITGDLRRVFEEPEDSLNALVFSADGLVLAAGGDDYALRLWDVRAGALLHTLSGHRGAVRAISFSPDSGRVASGGDDHCVRLWDVRTGALLAELTGHTAMVSSLDFSTDGDQLASASYDHTVRLWDARTGALLKVLVGHKERARPVVFSPDGDAIASGDQDGLVCLWDARTADVRERIDRPEEEKEPQGYRAVRSIAFSSDGGTLFFTTDGGAVWRRSTAPSGPMRLTMREQANAAFMTKDASLLVLSRADTVQVRATATGEIQRNLPWRERGLHMAALSPDGSRLAFPSRAGITLWDVSAGEPAQELVVRGTGILSMAFSSGGDLAAGTADGVIHVWSPGTDTPRITLRCSYDLQAPITRVRPASEWLRALAFSPDGSLLASGSVDGSIRLWDVSSGNVRALAVEHRDDVRALCFSPDGSFLASGSQDRTACLWDVRRASAHRKFVYPDTDGIVSAAYSPDGDALAVGSNAGIVRLLSVLSETPPRTLLGHGDVVLSLAYSPDGALLATTSHNAVWVFDARSGERLHVLAGHEDSVWWVAISVRGNIIFSGSMDGTVRLWSPRDGRCLAVLAGSMGAWAALVCVRRGIVNAEIAAS
ncbi:SIR2 family protein [Sorangium sp. So ce362]|uniref:SIR2 family protein n=1 Tax=Sorangium sp. So ce362 TaxID=3133303 RepID=UPI003F619720